MILQKPVGGANLVRQELVHKDVPVETASMTNTHTGEDTDP